MPGWLAARCDLWTLAEAACLPPDEPLKAPVAAAAATATIATTPSSAANADPILETSSRERSECAKRGGGQLPRLLGQVRQVCRIARVLGGQANLWAEYIPNLRQVEYMMFPRLGALSEVDWSPREMRDWQNFRDRTALNEKRLDIMGVNYRPLAKPD